MDYKFVCITNLPTIWILNHCLLGIQMNTDFGRLWILTVVLHFSPIFPRFVSRISLKNIFRTKKLQIPWRHFQRYLLTLSSSSKVAILSNLNFFGRISSVCSSVFLFATFVISFFLFTCSVALSSSLFSFSSSSSSTSDSLWELEFKKNGNESL